MGKAFKSVRRQAIPVVCRNGRRPTTTGRPLHPPVDGMELMLLIFSLMLEIQEADFLAVEVAMSPLTADWVCFWWWAQAMQRIACGKKRTTPMQTTPRCRRRTGTLC